MFKHKPDFAKRLRRTSVCGSRWEKQSSSLKFKWSCGMWKSSSCAHCLSSAAAVHSMAGCVHVRYPKTKFDRSPLNGRPGSISFVFVVDHFNQQETWGDFLHCFICFVLGRKFNVMCFSFAVHLLRRPGVIFVDSWLRFLSCASRRGSFVVGFFPWMFLSLRGYRSRSPCFPFVWCVSVCFSSTVVVLGGLFVL